MERNVRFLVLLMMLASLTGAQAGAINSTPAWHSKVDPWVLKTAEQGATEFLVFLHEQADLSVASRLNSKHEKGAYVYRQLTQTAQRTQGPVLAALQDLARRAPGQVAFHPYWIANLIWVRGDSELAQRLATRKDVAHLYANPQARLEEPALSKAALFPNLPSGVEWNIQKVDAPEAWAHGYTGQGVVIGGADTGYAWQHPALKAKYRGWNGNSADHNYNWYDAIGSGGGSCGPKSPEPCDDGYHGTHTMGIMVGDDGLGNQVGMAPGARWIGCRNMNVGWGTPETYTQCFQWFIAPTNLNDQNPRPDLAPDIINNSWRCTYEEGCTDNSYLKVIIENVRAAGILTVQSAGNQGFQCETIGVPAIYDASFTVGSTDSSDVIASNSSRGPSTVDGLQLIKPDISAPGVNIRSSIPSQSYYLLSGTSMAGPHVAGLAALMISAQPALAGQVDRLEQVIEQNAIPRTTSQICGEIPGSQTPNNTYGWGRIDAWAAVHSLMRQLAILVKPSVSLYDPGQIITYTLQVTYTFPESLTPAANVVISDALPAQTSFITATLPYTLIGNTIVWAIPSLDPGQSQTVQLVVKIASDANATIYNQDYSVRSAEVSPVYGPTVPVYLAHYLFMPYIEKPPP